MWLNCGICAHSADATHVLLHCYLEKSLHAPARSPAVLAEPVTLLAFGSAIPYDQHSVIEVSGRAVKRAVDARAVQLEASMAGVYGSSNGSNCGHSVTERFTVARGYVEVASELGSNCARSASQLPVGMLK